MMIVVVALAESEKSEEERVAGTAPGRIWLAANGVAGGVNQKRAVLDRNNLGHAANQESAERTYPSIPPRTQERW